MAFRVHGNHHRTRDRPTLHGQTTPQPATTTQPRPVARHPSRVLVFAASADKQVEKMLRTVRGLFDHVVITRYLNDPRAVSLDRLRVACHAAGLPEPEEAASPAVALRTARSLAGSRGIVVVAGSFFLAGEAGREQRVEHVCRRTMPRPRGTIHGRLVHGHEGRATAACEP